MKLYDIVSDPSFNMSMNASKLLENLIFTVKTMTGVILSGPEIKNMDKVAKNIAGRVKSKKWGKQGFLKWDQIYLRKLEIPIPGILQEQVREHSSTRLTLVH